MRLLVDENLSERLVTTLADQFPNSLHIRLLGLGGANDQALWDLALREGCTLLTRDEDFLSLSLLRGAPPKVVLLRLGNCSTSEVARLVRSSAADIRAFLDQPALSCLELGRRAAP